MSIFYLAVISLLLKLKCNIKSTKLLFCFKRYPSLFPPKHLLANPLLIAHEKAKLPKKEFFYPIQIQQEFS